MEVFAVQLVRPPAHAWETTRAIAGRVARLMAPRQSRRKKADWADLSRKRLGVVRFTPPKS